MSANVLCVSLFTFDYICNYGISHSHLSEIKEVQSKKFPKIKINKKNWGSSHRI